MAAHVGRTEKPAGGAAPLLCSTGVLGAVSSVLLAAWPVLVLAGCLVRCPGQN